MTSSPFNPPVPAFLPHLGIEALVQLLTADGDTVAAPVVCDAVIAPRPVRRGAEVARHLGDDPIPARYRLDPAGPATDGDGSVATIIGGYAVARPCRLAGVAVQDLMFGADDPVTLRAGAAQPDAKKLHPRAASVREALCSRLDNPLPWRNPFGRCRRGGWTEIRPVHQLPGALPQVPANSRRRARRGKAGGP